MDGVDFDSKAVEGVRIRYGFNVHVGSLESIAYTDNTFDAITMSHVIEHVSNPVALLQECYRILKPGGYLVLVTPNINSWGHAIFKYNWRGLEPPRHLHIFSQSTLQTCVKKAGFYNFDSWTTAAHSMYVLYGTLITKKIGHTQISKLGIFMISFLLEYYEFLLTKNNPELGEIVALLANKAIE